MFSAYLCYVFVQTIFLIFLSHKKRVSYKIVVE